VTFKFKELLFLADRDIVYSVNKFTKPWYRVFLTRYVSNLDQIQDGGWWPF